MRIQSNCKWNKQIDHIKSKIVPLIGVFRRIFPMIPVYVRKMLYFAFVHSQFIYFIPIWNKTVEYKIKELQVCQNKIIRDMFLEYCKSHREIHTLTLTFPKILKYRRLK
jgi:hypothetical protein